MFWRAPAGGPPPLPKWQGRREASSSPPIFGRGSRDAQGEQARAGERATGQRAGVERGGAEVTGSRAPGPRGAEGRRGAGGCRRGTGSRAPGPRGAEGPRGAGGGAPEGDRVPRPRPARGRGLLVCVCHAHAHSADLQFCVPWAQRLVVYSILHHKTGFFYSLLISVNIVF